MHVYLPIAEISVNLFVILGLGGLAGILSGMFGVGGGFLLTPLLIFIGVPPTVSVATSANQIIASSVSGFIAHWRRENVDFKMGGFLLVGGFIGSTLGVSLFRWLTQVGQIDIIISLFYVIFLGAVGLLMADESIRAMFNIPRPPKLSVRQKMAARLPWQVEFPRSKLVISGFLPIGIGFIIGIMVSLMGIGGGFFLIPAMIYILGMPTAMVIGTSLFQMIFITANVTLLQAITTQTVDILLAIILLTGSVFGAQFGTKLGTKLPAAHLRGLLAALVLMVAAKMALGLFATPANIFTVDVIQ